ncbi:hypothetical protein D6T63_16255 [Arthrobacter cheniae]|uniref:Tyr recombinase domain-containing protein n=1 Tax=Arthrobacter cheniae TaxID=1258888 RepID=A0A3A5LXY0_9MICC|nr:hypothetical protein D6T63_16255 [Arthrobacter cheniae]
MPHRNDRPAAGTAAQRRAGLHQRQRGSAAQHPVPPLVRGPTIAELTDPAASPRLDQAPTPHDLRHTRASWVIVKGVPLPVIQARLGHETIQNTVDTYGHLANDADSNAADFLD